MKLTGINSYTSWMVAVACSTINGLNLSAYRLAGLMYVAILERYDTDRQKASIPIILFILVRSLGGPFIGILGQKVGLEEITLIGCFLAAVGFGGSFFAEDIVAVTFFLGIVYGIGITFGNTLLPNILKKHFTKNFNSASGIYTAGSCVGAFVFPPIAVYLLEEYGVSGTFLIVSGLILNGLPVSMLVRLARSTLIKVPQKSRISQTEKGAEEEKAKIPLVPLIQDLNTHSDGQLNVTNKERNEINKMPDISSDFNSSENLGMYNKMNVQGSNINQLNGVSTTITENDKNYKQISNKSYVISKAQNEELCKEQRATLISKSSESQTQCTDLKHEHQLNGSEIKNNSSPNLTNSMDSCTKVRTSSPEATKPKGKESVFCSSLKIFADPTFFIIMVIQSFHAYVISLVWTTLIDYSRDKGIVRSKEIYMLMFHPLADIVGRLALGWVTDKGFLSLSKFTVFGFVLMGLSTVMIALSKTFAVMMTGALFFASTSGALFSIMPAMIFDFMDKDQHIMGLGSRSILYVPLCFTAAPLIGFFRGKIGSYDGLYYIFAAMCLICSCLTPLMSVFSIATKRKKEKSSESENIQA